MDPMTAPAPEEIERLKAVIARDLPACVSREPLAFTSNGIEGQVLIDSKALATAILSAGYSRTAASLERAAGMVDAECERVLGKQYPDEDGTSFKSQVNRNIRMTVVLLPDIAAAIRAAKGEG